MVLVVDDDASVQRSVGRALRDWGLAVLQLAYASRTVEVAAEQHPDLILMDIGVREVRSGLGTCGDDGRAALMSLKGDPRTADIPVFAYGPTDPRIERLLAFQLGADGYFNEPLALEVVCRRIVFRLEEFACVADPPACREPLDTWPDLEDVDRQQAEMLHVEEEKRASNSKISVTPVAPARGPVLVVEDDRDVRTSLCSLLEDEGFATLSASNGQEALNLLHSDAPAPSVILLDLMMPVMNGWELRRRLEHDPSIPPAPVVVMSAQSRDETLGSVAWLQKPLRVEQLLSTLAEAAGS
jgi:CheY-like chemotaxis protein